MDDVWADAWSAPTPGSSNDPQTKNSILTASKWNVFERDEDKDTVDVGVSSWTAGTSVDWGDTGTQLWQAGSSAPNIWDPPSRQESDAEQGEAVASTNDEEGSKNLEPRPILPTPPQSPLPEPSSPVSAVTPSPSAEDTAPSSPSSIRRISGSSAFGAFESAKIADIERSQADSWVKNSHEVIDGAVEEHWGAAWSSKQDIDTTEKDNVAVKDEWELAQEAKHKRDRKVPPQLLSTLIEEWIDYAKEFPSNHSADDTGAQSWRKGLDNVEGLNDLLESLIPAASFPPARFPKSVVSKAFNESLRLTRSFNLTQSSPMAHLYASKGSTEWERSVKARSPVAHDEWGWDLKHEPEEESGTPNSAKEKKGLLSFWSKKSSTIPTSDSTVSNKSGNLASSVSPKSPTTSAQPIVDTTHTPALVEVLTPTPAPVPATAAVEPTSDGSAPPPSVVSRLFNKFSRKSSVPVAPLEKDKQISTLSDKEVSALYDPTESLGIGATLPSKKLSSQASGKPPPLAPLGSSRAPGPMSPQSIASDASFDAKMFEAQILDVLGGVETSNGGGYLPVSWDLLDSPQPINPSPSISRPSVSSSGPMASPPPPHSPLSSQRSSTRTSSVSSPPPLLPPPAPPKKEARFSGMFAPSTPPPLPPPSQGPFSSQRYDSPLARTSHREIDEFSDLYSATSSSLSQPILAAATPSSNSGFLSASQSTSAASPDLGDFGDFVSSTLRTPSPPRVPQKPTNAMDQVTRAPMQKTLSSAGTFSALSPPLPKPLAPPPGTRPTPQRKQQDLLSDEYLLEHPSSSSMSAAPTLSPGGSHPALTLMPAFSSSSPSPARIQPSAPTLPQNASSSTAPTKSGLSAQDLSFFEGL